MSSPSPLAIDRSDESILFSSIPREHKPFAPQGRIVDVLYAKEDEVIVDGPANTGKSRGILEKLHLICTKYPGARCLIVRKTRASLTQSAMVTYEQFVAPAPPIVKWRTTEQEYRYNCGSRIVVGGLDKATRVLSTDYDIIYVQEAIEINEDEFETLVTRARNGIVPYNQVICDTNPGPAHHWLKKRWEDGKARRIKTTHQDNPRLYTIDGKITEQGKRYLGKLQNLSGSRYQRLYLGEWASVEGGIYEFDQAIHLVYHFTPPPDWRRFRVVDFGFTNPFVCQWWALDNDGRMYRYREIYMTKRTVREHSELIRALSDGEYIETTICDHDAEDRATLEENGIPTIPALKAISTGIQAVQERLKVQEDGRARIFFCRDSLVETDQDLVESGRPIRTEDEFDDYHWADNKTKEIPAKEHDHGMDATRYAVMYADNYSATGGFYL